MAQALPLILVRVNDDDTRCLVVVSPTGHAPQRSIHPVEVVGQFRLKDGDVDWSVNAFARGKAFTDFLHESIARNGPAHPALVAGAKSQGKGYLYVIDGRTATPQGDVPPDDIIGAFGVRDGQLGPYERFDSHRLYTERGFFQLDPLLARSLLKDLMALWAPRQIT